MSAKNMNHLVAPLDLLFTPEILTIGIGDGGNELGMGTVYNKIVKSTIPNAAEIACTVPSNHCLVASVSNWGGFALAAAIVLLDGGRSKEALTTEGVEGRKMVGMREAGTRDGVTRELGETVDGMSFEENMKVLNEIRRITRLYN